MIIPLSYMYSVHLHNSEALKLRVLSYVQCTYRDQRKIQNNVWTITIIIIIFYAQVIWYASCSCNWLNWGALDAWLSAPQLSLLQLSCTLLPSSPLAYPTDSTILLLTSYLPIKTLVSRQQSTNDDVLSTATLSGHSEIVGL